MGSRPQSVFFCLYMSLSVPHHMGQSVFGGLSPAFLQRPIQQTQAFARQWIEDPVLSRSSGYGTSRDDQLCAGTVFCLVLSREWGNGLLGLLWGTLRDYHRDPFPHSLLSTRQFCLGSLDAWWIRLVCRAILRITLSLSPSTFPPSLTNSLPLTRNFPAPGALASLQQIPSIMWEFPKIGGTLFWGPYNKNPTI